MLYDAYEVQRSLLAGASKLAGLGAGWLNNPANPWGYSSMGPLVSASLEVFAHATAPHGKPEFGIERVRVRGKSVAVREEILLRKPFGQLKHFVGEGAGPGPGLWLVRRCPATMRPCCAGRSSDCFQASTFTSPIGGTRSWCRCRTAVSTSTIILITWSSSSN